jgi:type II secretory pathway component PulF
MVYYYIRRNVLNNARTAGVVDALDYDDAYDQARSNGRFTVLSLVNNQTPLGWWEEIKGRLFDNEQNLRVARINFWKILRMHIKGGNERQALIAYIPSCPSRRLQSALESALAAMESNGTKFVDAIDRYPNVFPTATVALLKNAMVTGSSASTLTGIINDEMMQRRVKSGSIMDRMDAYVTYGMTLISLWLLAKTVVPQTVDQAQQAHVEGNAAIIAIQVLGAAGNALQTPVFYLIIALLILGGRAILQQMGQIERLLHWWEGVRWRLAFLRDADLNHDRTKALKTINDAKHGGIGDDICLEYAIRACSSYRFREGLQASLRSIESGDAKLSEAIAANPLWGTEICSYFAAHQKGGFYDDVQDILRTLAEDEENNRRMSAYAATGLHVLIALLTTAGLTIIVTFAQFVVIIAQARQL